MRLATVLTPIDDDNLQLAAQCGVTDLVARYYGPDAAALQQVQDHARRFDLTVSVVEGYLPIEHLKLGTDDGTELAAMQLLIRQLGDAGIPLLCYNFMSGTDWVRTRTDLPARGGATVTEFRLAEVERAMSLNGSATTGGPTVTADQLWGHLERMLNALLPVAEQAGVTLAMHPDDPPLPELLGRGRIMCSVENFERLMQLVPSPANKICFCQGSFASMGVDVLDAIHRLGPHIRYVHCRDVAGIPTAFAETFHDNGPTDMVSAIQAYWDAGFRGPIRPDHVPMYVGEVGEPGYTMLGRLFAYGYLRGLIQAAMHRGKHSSPTDRHA